MEQQVVATSVGVVTPCRPALSHIMTPTAISRSLLSTAQTNQVGHHLTMDLNTVKTIRKELLSNERKLEESMAHTREVSKLINIIERAIKEKEEEIASLKTRLAVTRDSLSRTESSLSACQTTSWERKEEVETLSRQLTQERAEVKLLKSQLGSLQSELTDTRSTSWKRKEELDSLNKQVIAERAQVKSLKAAVEYKDKAGKELEEKIDDIRKIHFNREKESQNEKKELERSSLIH